MQRYKDKNGNAGILAYEIAAKSLTVKFKDGETYLYDYTKPGLRHIEAMKKLARRGFGLTTYINKNVRDDYAQKLA